MMQNNLLTRSILTFTFFFGFIIGLTPMLAQDIEYELTGDSIVYGELYNIVYICDGVLHNNSNDFIQVRYKQINFVTDSEFIRANICTDSICYYVSTTETTEFVPPGENYKCQLRWVFFESNDLIEDGYGYTEWELVNENNNQVIDTIDCEFFFNFTSAVSTSTAPEFKIYPNPVSETLFFEGIQDGTIIKIFSADGESHLSAPLSSGSINISDLSPGYYFGKLKTDRTVEEFNFIKL